MTADISDELYEAAVTAYFNRRFGFRTDDREFIGLLLDNELHEGDFRAALAVAYAAGQESTRTTKPAPEVPVSLPEGYEWCTTSSRTKRHISRSLTIPQHRAGHGLKGRKGPTLCGQNGRDEEYVQWELDHWRASGKPFVVARLPLCRLCPKSLPAGEA